jgi:hypothetical protein
MRRTALGLACLLATVAMTACTPFFYGGVVLIGPGQENAPVDSVGQVEGSE